MSPQEPPRTTLESWKEIAAYLQRDAKTARRWEKEEGLPVHRHSHNRRSSVYAYPDEIDAWRISRRSAADPLPAVLLWRRLLTPSFALAMLMSLILVGNYAHPGIASAQGTHGGVRVSQIHTAREQELTYWNISWNGRFAGATDDTANAVIVDLESGTVRAVTNFAPSKDRQDAGKPQENLAASLGAISRDGKQAAYWHYGQSLRGQLDVAEAGGKNPRTLYRSKDSDVWGIPRDWSPDGKWIALQVERDSGNHGSDGTTDFLMVPTSGGAPRTIKTAQYSGGHYRPRILFSPDGRFVAYDFPVANDRKQSRLFVTPTTGGGDVTVAAGPGSDELVGWAPDGGLVFTSTRGGDPNLYYVAIRDGRQAGEPQIVRRGFEGQPIGVTRSGALVYEELGIQSSSFIAPLDASGNVGQPRAVSASFPDSNEAAVWSPDGARLAYIRTRRTAEGVPTLQFRQASGGEEREVTPSVHLRPYTPLGWTLDGQSVLAIGVTDQKLALYRINVTTGDAAKFWDPSGVAAYPVDWSEDARWIFHRQGGRRIGRRDSSSGQEKLIYQAEPDHLNNFYRVSPDGSRVAFVQESTRGETLGVVSAEGGSATTLFSSDTADYQIGSLPGSIAWTRDGKFILFARVSEKKGRSELWMVASDGGAARKIELAIEGRLGWLNVHPDEKQLAYTQFRAVSEYWSLESFLPGSR